MTSLIIDVQRQVNTYKGKLGMPKSFCIVVIIIIDLNIELDRLDFGDAITMEKLEIDQFDRFKLVMLLFFLVN